MTQTDPTDTPTSSDVLNSTDGHATPAAESQASTVNSPEPVSGITSAQVEQIISHLKSLKQNLFILTLIGGFFAVRAILFHR